MDRRSGWSELSGRGLIPAGRVSIAAGFRLLMYPRLALALPVSSQLDSLTEHYAVTVA